jgi:GNAT superfamily N-acetyltransferase
MEQTTGASFREATIGDEDRLTVLERSANLRALAHIFPPEQHPYPTDDVRDRWLALLRDPSVCVAVSEDADGLTSFVAFDSDLLRHLAVRPDLWGTGLAKDAMDWALVREPLQRLWCLEANSRALAFYERRGWTRTGRRQHSEFPPHPVEVELVPTRDQSSAPSEMPAPS